MGGRTPSNSWATHSLQADSRSQGTTQNGQMTLAVQKSLFPPCLWPSSNFVPPSTNNRFTLPILQMENSGRGRGKKLVYCPALVTPGGLQTLSLTGGPTRDSLSLESAVSSLPPLQRDSRGGGQGASSEVAVWSQPFPWLGQLCVPTTSQLFPALPCF